MDNYKSILNLILSKIELQINLQHVATTSNTRNTLDSIKNYLDLDTLNISNIIKGYDFKLIKKFYTNRKWKEIINIAKIYKIHTDRESNILNR